MCPFSRVRLIRFCVDHASMQDDVMACFGGCIPEREGSGPYVSHEEAKKARLRDKELTKLLTKQHKEDLKRLKLLLLGENKCSTSCLRSSYVVVTLLSTLYLNYILLLAE